MLNIVQYIQALQKFYENIHTRCNNCNYYQSIQKTGFTRVCSVSFMKRNRKYERTYKRKHCTVSCLFFQSRTRHQSIALFKTLYVMRYTNVLKKKRVYVAQISDQHVDNFLCYLVLTIQSICRMFQVDHEVKRHQIVSNYLPYTSDILSYGDDINLQHVS